MNLQLMGVSLGKLSMCVGYRKALNTHLTCRDECLFEANTACHVQLVRLVRCGDDFSLSETKVALQCIPRWVGEAFVGQDDSCDGTNVEIGDVQEAIHLNRLCRLYPPGAEVGGPLTRGNPGVTDGTEQRKRSCEYSWCADD